MISIICNGDGAIFFGRGLSTNASKSKPDEVKNALFHILLSRSTFLGMQDAVFLAGGFAPKTIFLLTQKLTQKRDNHLKVISNVLDL